VYLDSVCKEAKADKRKLYNKYIANCLNDKQLYKKISIRKTEEYYF